QQAAIVPAVANGFRLYGGDTSGITYALVSPQLLSTCYG
ncbi:MAG: hypothetical protein ACI8UP_005031, partial [Porticoccaceae bacterium]